LADPYFYWCISAGAFLSHRKLARSARKYCGVPETWNTAKFFHKSRARELPCFNAQKNVRRFSDLSAKRNAPFGNPRGAAGFLEGNVSFLFYFDENVTVAVRMESAK
jgi:hypothetical protein